MAKLWQRTRDASGKSQLHDISLTDLRIEKPSVIFLSGYFTTDDQPGYIAGALKRLEEMMHNRPGYDDLPANDAAPEQSPLAMGADGSTPTPAEARRIRNADKPVDLYTWSHTSLANIFNMAAYNVMPGSRASQPAQNLAQAVIMPLVAKDFGFDGNGQMTGTPLPADEAKKNLRNITFFAYSAGTIVAQECFNASMKMMQKIGYTKDQARDVLHEVALVSTGNVSRPTKEKDRFTTLYLVASNDRIIRAKNRIWRPLKTLFARFARNLNIKALSATSAFISAAVTREKFEWRMRDGKTWKEKIKPLIPSWTMIKSYHELPHYITHDENLSQFAKIVQYSLTNAINRAEGDGKTITPMQMLAPPNGVAAEEVASYNQKIAKAIVPEKVRI